MNRGKKYIFDLTIPICDTIIECQISKICSKKKKISHLIERLIENKNHEQRSKTISRSIKRKRQKESSNRSRAATVTNLSWFREREMEKRTMRRRLGTGNEGFRPRLFRDCRNTSYG